MIRVPVVAKLPRVQGATRVAMVQMSTRDRIEEVLDSIRPAIQADGGDVEFLEFHEDSGVVEVRLLGACESCPISMMTLKDGIEQRLRVNVAGVEEVVAV